MASGHANRAHRPNTWLHRPATRREILLANPEPSTHGTTRTSRDVRAMSALEGISEGKCLMRVFRSLTFASPETNHRFDQSSVNTGHVQEHCGGARLGRMYARVCDRRPRGRYGRFGLCR